MNRIAITGEMVHRMAALTVINWPAVHRREQEVCRASQEMRVASRSLQKAQTGPEQWLEDGERWDGMS